MKIIASWNYSEDLDNLEKALAKEYSRLIPKEYVADNDSKKTPLSIIKWDTSRISGLYSP